MTLLADIVVITTNPGSGEPILYVRNSGYKILGGAALYELIDRGKLGLAGEGRGTRVVVLDPTPVPEPSLEYGFATARKHEKQLPRNAVLRLAGGFHLYDGIYGGLAQEGVLGRDQKSGPFSPHRFQVLHPARRDALIDGLRAVLLGGQAPDEHLRRLAALLVVADDHAGPLLDIVIDRHIAVGAMPASERRPAKEFAARRALELAKGDWIAATTLQAILLPLQIETSAAAIALASAMIPN